jgi:hypothetical protein
MEVRDRILDVVEQAIDRISDVVEDTPTPGEAAQSMRRYTRNRELASAAFIAGAPALARAARERIMSRRASRSTFAVIPVTVASRPLLIGTGVVGGVVASALLIRAIRKRRARRTTEITEFDPTRFDLEDEVARMQDEGGDAAGAAEARYRRFVRSGSESTTTR